MNQAAALLRGFWKRLPRVFAGLLVAALIGEIAWLIWVGPILPQPREAAVPAPVPAPRLPPPSPKPEPEPEPATPVKKPSPMPAAEIAKLDRMLAAASKLPPPRKPRKNIQPASKPRALASYAALATFRDCGPCPLMTVLPAGRFNMGAARGNAWEKPRHNVSVPRFAIGRFEISERQWQACAADDYCAENSGRGTTLPVVAVSWHDAQDYVDWLSDKSGRRYRLPSEAEWAYAIRAGGSTSRFWGDDRRGQCLYANGADRSLLKLGLPQTRHAECNDGHARRAPAGRFRPNAFGLRDMAGNVWEWVQDCWADNFRHAPGDGSAVSRAQCPEYVIRGGSWRSEPEAMRSTERARALPGQRSDDLGFRVATD